MSKEDWEKVKTKKVRGDLKDTYLLIIAEEARAIKIIKDNPWITPEQFGVEFQGRGSKSADLTSLYNHVIMSMKMDGKVETPDLYRLALRSLKLFGGNDINFFDITEKFLERYERWMLSGDVKSERKPKSRTTISIYLRTLRAIFNIAIEKKMIPSHFYPFGRKRFIIPEGRAPSERLAKSTKMH